MLATRNLRGTYERHLQRRRSLALGLVLIASTMFVPLSRVAWPGNWSAPPPLSAEEISNARAVVTDPRQSPAAKVSALRSTMERDGGPEKLRLLEEVANVPGQHAAVRLASLHGLERSTQSGKATPEIRTRIAEAIRETLALKDAFALELARDAIRSGWGFGWDSRDEGRRRLALMAVSHSEVAIRRAALEALGHCGTAADAEIVQRCLSNPRSPEFMTALEAAGRNEAMAQALRQDLLDIARTQALSTTVRALALMAVPAPYAKENLELAVCLYAMARQDHEARCVENQLIESIRKKARVEQAMPYLVRCAGIRGAGDPRWSGPSGPLRMILEFVKDENPRVREAAGNAIPLQLLRGCLRDVDRQVRCHALWLIPACGTRAKDLLPDLSRYFEEGSLEEEEDRSLQEQALLVIDTFGAEAKCAVPAISKLLLRSQDRRLRSSAFYRVCSLAAPEVLVSVIGKVLQQEELLSNDIHDLRAQAIQAARRMGPAARPLLPFLRKLADTKGPDWYTRELAEHTIADIEKKAPR